VPRHGPARTSCSSSCWAQGRCEGGSEYRYIEDGAGKRIVAVGSPPNSVLVLKRRPASARRRAFRAGGGRARAAPLVELAVIALLLGGTLGMGIYLALAHLPMRDMERAMDS